MTQTDIDNIYTDSTLSKLDKIKQLEDLRYDFLLISTAEHENMNADVEFSHLLSKISILLISLKS